MIEDRLSRASGFDVPICPTLVHEPVDPAPTPEEKVPRFKELLAAAEAERPVQTEAEAGPDDRQATEAVVSVMLAEAARASLGHTLLQRFNTQSHPSGPLGQLTRFVHDFSPIIVIESEIPFVEDIVVGLLDPQRQAFPRGGTERAERRQRRRLALFRRSARRLDEAAPDLISRVP
jgi:hypothetical protein